MDMAEGDSMDTVDFISYLPDEILHHILTFVPTNLAIRTCVLSRRWRHIWREIPSLSLDCGLGTFDYAQKTLTSYRAPKLSSFHLCFRFDDDWFEYSEPITGHEYFFLDTCIEFAMSHNPENLYLDLRLQNYRNYKLQDIFYVNSFVKRLHFRSCITLTPRPTVFWPSLKSCYLCKCNVPDESAAKILSGCPLLESLTLINCKMLGRLDLTKSMHLKILEIELYKEDSGPTEIVAPHIHYLSLKNTAVSCSLVDVSSLTEAQLNKYFLYTRKEVYHVHVLDLNTLAKVHHIQKLTLGAIFLQILSLAELHGCPFPMLKITSLTLETEIFRYLVPGIARLLQNSPELKMLTVHFKTCKILYENELGEYSDPRGLEFGVLPTSSEPKLIALFIEFLLGNTTSLETLVVRLENNLDATRFQDLLQMTQTLSHNHNNLSILLKQKH